MQKLKWDTAKVMFYSLATTLPAHRGRQRLTTGCCFDFVPLTLVLIVGGYGDQDYAHFLSLLSADLVQQLREWRRIVVDVGDEDPDVGRVWAEGGVKCQTETKSAYKWYCLK